MGDIEVIELKLKLKQWELCFFKKNGKKPTKQDICKDKAIEKIYLDYARLKKSSKLNDEKKVNVPKIKSELQSEVWGSNLLKASSNVQNFEKVVNGKTSEQLQTSTTFCGKTFKKNLSSSSLKNVPLSLKRKKLSNSAICSTAKKTDDSKNSSPFFLPKSKNNDEEQLSLHSDFINVSSNDEIIFPGKDKQCKVANKFPRKLIINNQENTNSLYKNYAKKTNAFSFLNKPIQATWLKEDNSVINFDCSGTCKDNNKTTTSNTKTNDKSTALTFNTKTNERSTFESVPEFCTFEKKIESDNTVKNVFKSECIDTNDNMRVENNEMRVKNNIESEVCSVKKFSDDEETGSDKLNNLNKTTCLKTKLSTGQSSLVSNNFVRINIKKKVYLRKSSRGNYLRKKIYFEKLAKKGYGYRRWKNGNRNAFQNSVNDNKCFKCGQYGHWANKCSTKDNLSVSQSTKFNSSRMDEKSENIESIDELVNHHKLSFNPSIEPSVRLCQVLRQSDPVYNPQSLKQDEVKAVLEKFGYSQFRPGQEQAMHRILYGKPSLLVLSTGMGKSLCYQLPAFMYSQKRSSLTLVISPLVSLMDDQVSGLPNFLKPACLHSGMSKDQRDKIMVNIEEGKIDILLVSPETITSWAGMSPHTSPFSKLPPVSFVCIDECHCLSEWSHSFRPSYLRVCQVLKEQLGVKCLVGLTATCTLASCKSIAKQLGITDFNDGVIIETKLPDNLTLSASKDRYKDEALVELLTSERFKSLRSVIVYCTRRDEASRLASYLRTALQNLLETDKALDPLDLQNDSVSISNSKKRKRSSTSKSSKRKVCSWDVDCYHAGMSPAERRKVQKKFMKGELRIVVATIAFGMGIDKQDVRAVLHYNVPRSFERYVQEIGRAGRDGLPAQCHTFLDGQEEDISELSRHIYAKTVDQYVIKKLVEKVFKPCKCSLNGRTCGGHVIAIPIDDAIEELDVSREGIETLLCYLESESLIQVFLPTRSTCSVRCYDGPKQMASVARKCPAVAFGLAVKGSDASIESELEFSVVEAADELGTDIFTLQRSLRGLMWDTTLSADGSSGRSGVVVEFKDLAFLLRTRAESNHELLDQVTSSLHERVLKQEAKELAQLRTCFDTLQKFSFPDVPSSRGGALQSKSDDLKAVVNEYFAQEEIDVPKWSLPKQIDSSLESDLRSSIRQFLTVYSTDLGTSLTGRSIARIFHGIDSPRYPAKTWGTVRRFWRSRLSIDFNLIFKVATDELLKFR